MWELCVCQVAARTWAHSVTGLYKEVFSPGCGESRLRAGGTAGPDTHTLLGSPQNRAVGAWGLGGGTTQCMVLELQRLPKTAPWRRYLRTSYTSSGHRAHSAMGQGLFH